MKKIMVLFAVLCIPFVTGFAGEDLPKRLKRSESFLGLHFDFHAGDDCTEIGKDVDREMVEYILDSVKPDYVQCDCKGHPGLSSYPTDRGNRAPGFVRDPLEIWREVTEKRGVALYVHYSGVWDNRAIELHPEWACVDEEGNARKNPTSVFSPYVDELLIPQIKELIDRYRLDGIWIDGDCWATERDYSEKSIRLFRETTGIADVPRKPEDPGWNAFSDFSREGFRAYVKRYVDALHRHNPEFQIASNWAYSSMMPEPVTIDVDFISGDYSAKNSINSARFEGRAMVYQGKPWDLMAWSFTWTDGLYSTKTVPQLEQEAAVVLALGGGFQAYFPQKRDGSIRKWQMNLMREVALFSRERQAVSHKAKPVPQIGLILDGKVFYRKNRKLFGGWSGELNAIRGILQCLLDGQQVVDIAMEHHLEGRALEYPLLIYPEWDGIDPAFKAKLLEYVRNGGTLLVIGARAVRGFGNELNVRFTGEPGEQVAGLAQAGWLAGLKTEYQPFETQGSAVPYGEIYENNDFSGEPRPAASVTDFGKGRLAAIYLNLGERYLNSATSVERDFLYGVVKSLFPDPVVEVAGSHHVDVTLNRIGEKLTVHLVNTAGPHQDRSVNVFDEIPETGPLSVTVRYPSKPERMTLEPGGNPLKYKYKKGRIELKVPGLRIHEIIVIEGNGECRN